MLVQKIATKGASSVHPSHMKETLYVPRHIELKIVTVLRYFMFVVLTVSTVLINAAQKLDFVKKWSVIDHCKCHFVLKPTKVHKEELNFSKTFF
jgi:hypothetical protein